MSPRIKKVPKKTVTIPVQAFTFSVPMPNNVTNVKSGGGHWRSIHKAKKDYHATLTLMQTLGMMPPKPDTPHAQATVRSSMVLGGAMDDDNAIARHKPLLDWIVRAGYIKSDRRTCLRWEGMPDQRVSRKEPASITLTITVLETVEVTD